MVFGFLCGFLTKFLLHFIDIHRYASPANTADYLCIRSFRKLRAFALGCSFSPLYPRVDGFPVLGLLRPFRHFLRSLTFRRAFAPLLLPISLGIPEEASRVQQIGLQRDVVGGVFLYAPSALCGSPVLTQGRSGLPVLSQDYAPRVSCDPYFRSATLRFPLYWLTYEARYVRGSVSRRAMHASYDSP